MNSENYSLRGNGRGESFASINRASQPATGILPLDVVDHDAEKLSDVGAGTWNLILFYRDEECPRCQAYFDQVAQRRDKIEKSDVQLVALSTDTRERAESFTRQHALWFPVGYGLELQVAEQIGIYANAKRGCFEPAFFIVDPERRIVHVSIQSGPSARPGIEELIAIVDKHRRRG